MHIKMTGTIMQTKAFLPNLQEYILKFTKSTCKNTMLNETQIFMEKFNYMLFKGKKNQFMRNRQNRSTDHTTIQVYRQKTQTLTTLKVFNVMLMHLLKIFTMHRETAQLLVTVLEFDKKIKFLQRRECLSSVPNSDNLMPTQHCIQWVPAALSLDIIHPV